MSPKILIFFSSLKLFQIWIIFQKFYPKIGTISRILQFLKIFLKIIPKRKGAHYITSFQKKIFKIFQHPKREE